MRGRTGILCFLSFLLLLWPGFGNDVQTQRIRKIGKSPNFIALAPDGSSLYATSYGTNELLEIDPARKLISRSVGVGASPLGLAIDDLGKTALVACKDTGTVTFVDLDSFRVISDLKVTGQPNSIAISPRGYRAYVSTYGRSREGWLHIVDIRERRLIGSVKLGVAPFGLVVSPTTEEVFVVVGGDNEIAVVNPDRQEVVRKIAVGEGPDGIAITPDGKRVFVANSRTGDLSVIDAQLMSVLITIPIGKMPFGVAVSPDGKRVFVVNNESRNVAYFPADLSSLEIETFAVDRGPTDVEVASDNRTVYVVNELSNSIVIATIADK